MLQQNGLRNDRTHTSGPGNPENRNNDVKNYDYEIEHSRILPDE